MGAMTEIFLGGEALAAGHATRQSLRTRYRAVHRGVYVSRDATLTLRDRAVAAWLASRRKGVVAGTAAAALHGAAWLDADAPIELLGATCQAQRGLVPLADRFADDEVTVMAGLPVTTRVRTAFDIGRHLDRREALTRLDALMWSEPYAVAEVDALAGRYPRAQGVRRLRELLPLVDGGAATPRESRVRLWLIDAGLPAPETQIPVVQNGEPVAFLDMGWPDCKVAVDCDADVAKLQMLHALGWAVVPVADENRPVDWLAAVEDALARRGFFVEIHAA
jgi:hypothetical protein